MNSDAIFSNNLGINEYNKGNFEKALEYFKESLSKKNDDMIKNNIANTLNEIAKKCLYNGKLNEALNKISEALNYCSKDFENYEIIKNNYNSIKSLILNSEGIELFSKDKFNEALIKFDEAYKLCLDERLKKDILNNESEVYFGLYQNLIKFNKIEEANKNLETAINLCSSDYKNKFIFEQARNSSKFINILVEAQINFDNKNYKQALEQFKQAEKIITEPESNKMIKNNIAECYNQIANSLNNEKKYNEALNNIKKALEICSEDYNKKELFNENLKTIEIEQKIFEGEEFYNKKDYNLALNRFNSAINIYKTLNNKNDIIKNKLYNNKALCMQLIGSKLINEKKIKEGIFVLNEALKICENIPECRNSINKVLEQIKIQEKINEIEELIKNNKKDEALNIIKNIELNKNLNDNLLKQIKNYKIDILLNQGINHLKNKEFNEAFPLIEEAYNLSSTEDQNKNLLDIYHNYSKAMFLKTKGDKLLKEKNYIAANKAMNESEELLIKNEKIININYNNNKEINSLKEILDSLNVNNKSNNKKK